MNTELLQQILEMVGQAGEGSFILAVIYIAYPYFSMLIVLAAIYIVASAFTRFIGHLTFGRRVATAVGEVYHGEMNESDRVAILQRIQKYRDNQK